MICHARGHFPNAIVIPHYQRLHAVSVMDDDTVTDVHMLPTLVQLGQGGDAPELVLAVDGRSPLPPA